MKNGHCEIPKKLVTAPGALPNGSVSLIWRQSEKSVTKIFLICAIVHRPCEDVGRPPIPGVLLWQELFQQAIELPLQFESHPLIRNRVFDKLYCEVAGRFTRQLQ